VKSVSFIPSMAVLGVELHQFRKDERGGLWTVGYGTLSRRLEMSWENTLDNLTESSPRSSLDSYNIVDEKFLDVMKRFGKKDLFIKKDIKNYDLMTHMLNKSLHKDTKSLDNDYIFPEKRTCRIGTRHHCYKQVVQQGRSCRFIDLDHRSIPYCI